MNLQKTGKSNPTAHEILSLVSSLDEPVDYFSGLSTTSRIRPEAILCYTRKSAKRLLESNQADRDIHHRFVLIVALSGSGHVSIGPDTFNLAEMEAILVFPFQFHHYSNLERESVQWLFITFECNEEAVLNQLKSHDPVSIDDKGSHLLIELLNTFRARKNRINETGLYLEIFLFHLINTVNDRVTGEGAIISKRVDESLLDRVNRWILNRQGQDFQISGLAVKLGYSESHLRALFRAKTNHSLGKHILRMRLLKSCRLLLNSNKSITEVGELCGFDTLYSYSRAFSRVFKTSPTNYRRKILSYN